MSQSRDVVGDEPRAEPGAADDGAGMPAMGGSGAQGAQPGAVLAGEGHAEVGLALPDTPRLPVCLPVDDSDPHVGCGRPPCLDESQAAVTYRPGRGSHAP